MTTRIQIIILLLATFLFNCKKNDKTEITKEDPPPVMEWKKVNSASYRRILAISGNRLIGIPWGYLDSINFCYVSSDIGATWASFDKGLPSRPTLTVSIGFTAIQDSTLFIGIGRSLYSLKGENWVNLNTPQTGSWFDPPEAIVGIAESKVYAVSEGSWFTLDKCYRSENWGNSWQNNQLPYGAHIIEIDGSVAYVGRLGKTGIIGVGYGGGAYRSTDNCVTWTKCELGIPDTCTIGSIKLLGSKVYAYVSSSTKNESDIGWYVSLDNGVSWSRAVTWSEISRDSGFLTSDNKVYAYFDKIFLSTDSGDTWTEIKKEWNSAIYDLAVCDKKLIASSAYDGIFSKEIK